MDFSNISVAHKGGPFSKDFLMRFLIFAPTFVGCFLIGSRTLIQPGHLLSVLFFSMVEPLILRSFLSMIKSTYLLFTEVKTFFDASARTCREQHFDVNR